ncbi:leucine-rich repeat protein [Mycoplasmatota bacterium]|nr:leucine-rich repeat protein [Mycoplasmatota bacterium]
MKKIMIIIFIYFLSTIIVGCNVSENNQYTITFDSNGGTDVSAITHDYNTQITEPDAPTKTGYTFGGWYSDSNLTTAYEFMKMPSENITLYAKWLSTEGLNYTSLGYNTCSVSGYSGSYPYLLIPKYYNGCLITTIGDYVFTGATSLTSITIPNSVTTIGAGAFSSATSLTAVIFEEGSQLTTIGNSAFSRTEITSITIPNSVTTIGDLAFSRSGITSITIPNSVTTIGRSVFFGATSLTSINVDVDNLQFCSKDGFLLNKNQTKIIAYPAGNNETTYTIPNSVTTIDYETFSGATSLTSITIPKSVTTIGRNAFSGATSLTSINVDVDNPRYISKDGVLLNKNQTTIIAYPVGNNETTYTIPDSVTTIGDCAFFGATSLTSITIPNSVTTIGNDAFSTTSLTSIIITATTPPSIDDNLGVLNRNLKIYVPSDYVSIYKTWWSYYARIIFPIDN